MGKRVDNDGRGQAELRWRLNPWSSSDNEDDTTLPKQPELNTWKTYTNIYHALYNESMSKIALLLSGFWVHRSDNLSLLVSLSLQHRFRWYTFSYKNVIFGLNKPQKILIVTFWILTLAQHTYTNYDEIATIRIFWGLLRPKITFLSLKVYHRNWCWRDRDFYFLTFWILTLAQHTYTNYDEIATSPRYE